MEDEISLCLLLSFFLHPLCILSIFFFYFVLPHFENGVEAIILYGIFAFLIFLAFGGIVTYLLCK